MRSFPRPFGVGLSALVLSSLACMQFACSSDSSATNGDQPGVDGGLLPDGGRPITEGGVPEGGSSGDAGGFDGNTTPSCIEAAFTPRATDNTFTDEAGTATVAVTGSACARTFALSSTATQRENGPKARTIKEEPFWPSLQSGNALFDALYTMALEETRENSVSEIKDYAFNNGQGLPCAAPGCFETGKLWTYVWTRDTSYAVHLGLAAMDPARAKTSLLFKLSPRRNGFEEQIVQDTGTGGSYPVSTDRVVWALGATETLKFLTGKDREELRDRAYAALRNTIEQDRVVAFDEKDGLYRGEQSFLDWREQSYPSWTATDTSHIAMSKALSTNVLHAAAMTRAAELATEKGDSMTASKFQGWAKELKTAIRARLYLAGPKQLSTFITTTLDGAPAQQFDLLGASLAVLEDVTTGAEAQDVISNYPMLPKGPPVMWPQQKDTPIYHNRSVWPFVTAYGLKAAKKTENAKFATASSRSLLRGAALYLSNMENLELVTGTVRHEDGANTGPVVNSHRQLWSVAGYLSMVQETMFGIEASQTGLRVKPFITKAQRNQFFGAASKITLNNFPYRGKRISVVITLPAAATGDGDGVLSIKSVKLNGLPVGEGFVPEGQFTGRNMFEVELAEGGAGPGALRLVTDTSDYKKLFGPKVPAVSSVVLEAGKLRVALDRNGEAAGDVTFSVYRDGQRVAENLPGSTASYLDVSSTPATKSHCYTVETVYASGNTSQRANPQCYWGNAYERVIVRAASGFTAQGGSLTTDYGRTFYSSWGDSGHTLTAPSFTAPSSGEYLLQASYGNGAGPVNTGITCAVKVIRVEDTQGGAVVAKGYLVMPQRGSWSTWGESSLVRATLVAGKTYRMVLADDDFGVNMSSFMHFASYGGNGGASGVFDRVNVAELKALQMSAN